MTRRISPHAWGPEEIGRLWNWVGSRPAMRQTYFTFAAGRGVIGFLACAGLLRGKVLDFGCGPGFLTELLVASGLETHAADSSSKSIAEVEARLAGKPNWLGARIIDGRSVPFPDDSFDLITCIETIEHVPETGVPSLMAELKRMLKPGGTLLLTTPNEEDLEANLNYCPFCDTEFHRWQHLRSWSAAQIGQLVRAAGLSPLLIQATDFSRFQSPVRLPGWRSVSLNLLRDHFNFFLMQALDRHRPRSFPEGREFRFRLGHGGPSLCVVATK